MKNMKRILALLLALTMLFVLAACAQKDNSATPAEDAQTNDTAETETVDTNETAEKEFKCAFLIPGPITDMSWCYNEYLGYEMVVEAG